MECFNHDFDDEEMIENIYDNAVDRKPYTVREREDHMEKWDEDEFFFRFRLRKNSVRILLEMIENQLMFRTNRNIAVSPMNQLLLSLRFYASGSMLISVGDFCGIHKSTACRIIQRVSTVLASLSPQFISFPDDPESRLDIQKKFFKIAKFPRVLGSIDCTHIKIQSPGGNNAEYYRNRKGYFSLNIQAICDANLIFRNIVARWPGATHDSLIFSNSAICADFASGGMGNGFLLGDSGYPSEKYMMIPLNNPIQQEEILYNESQIRTRNSIERCFGVWKRRFPILSLGIRLKLTTVQDIIVATAVLHNIARMQNEDEPEQDPEILILVNDEEDNNINQGGGNDAARRALIANYFSRLN